MLAYSRYLNLIYYRVLQGLKEEDREKFEALLKEDTVVHMSTVDGQPRARKAPSWWKGDSAAAASSIEAARQMGFVVGQVN